MKAYIKAHNKYLDSAEISQLTLKYHLKQITWLQHERLIHLIVLCLTTLVFLCFFVLGYITIQPLVLMLCIILGILEMFYVMHYFLLENTVQKWYVIANKMEKELNE